MAARASLSPRLMAYAQHVREHFPLVIAGTTVADLDALADNVCTSVDDFPLTTGVLGCTVFEDGGTYTAIREGLRQDEPARYRFTLAHELSEILLRRYLDTLPDQCRREHICDAFAAELLLPHTAVLASVAVLIQAHADGVGRLRQRSTSWPGASHPPMTYRSRQRAFRLPSASQRDHECHSRRAPSFPPSLSV